MWKLLPSQTYVLMLQKVYKNYYALEPLMWKSLIYWYTWIEMETTREYPIHIWPLNCLILLEMLKDVYSCFYGLVSKSWWEVCCPWSIGREICCNHVRLSLYILAFFFIFLDNVEMCCLFPWCPWATCVHCSISSTKP